MYKSWYTVKYIMINGWYYVQVWVYCKLHHDPYRWHSVQVLVFCKVHYKVHYRALITPVLIYQIKCKSVTKEKNYVFTANFYFNI